MSPLRMRNRRKAGASSILMVAVGALAGLAIGSLLAERTGGIGGLLTSSESRRRKRRDNRREAIEARSRMSFADDDDDFADDEDGKRDSRHHAALDDAHASTASEGFAAEREIPDDTTLEERVLEAFHNDPVLSERAIDIGAIGTGVIELTGWVQASWEIGHAVTLARGVPDVSTVVDRLAVRDGERRRDHSARHYATDPRKDPRSADDSSVRAD
ncbi:MAG: BON domain-containing protein [Gemmatimonadota bacterium]|nr:BON domain-containing protein [Gemmatimonadota bacterium]